MKGFKKLLAITMVAAMMLGLVACGGGKSISGTFKVSSVDGKSVEDTIKEAEAAGLTMSASDIEDLMVIEFGSGDSVTVKSAGESKSGTYKLDGETLSITIDNETENFTYSGDEISMDADGSKIVLKKK